MMSRFIPNTVASVANPPLLVIFIADEQTGWCTQYSEEGYNVMHVSYPPMDGNSFAKTLLEAVVICEQQSKSGDWAFLSFGIEDDDLNTLVHYFKLNGQGLKTAIHYCPKILNAEKLLLKDDSGKLVSTLVHLSCTQDELAASLVTAVEAGEHVQTTLQPPAPALVVAGEKSSTDPYTRSAVSLSYSRTLDLLRRHIGPYYELEKLWEKHTYYEFAERDSRKTMSTMASAENTAANYYGGVGYDDLARFYKVTPPDTELITVSRTVGADRIVDEMIFKCTHTTEIDYFLPGIKPTGKPLELAVVGIVAFRGDKLTFEHIYWDQASALVQLGLLERRGLPVAGVEVARKVLDPFGVESNKLMAKWKESEGLPI
ncbi:hypothetical protein NM688_g5159 [Phlebia brevispora]|uniref:Uncharacterized protein n=1 Tax=Phlebia brevispora TaxID=194682 RepID=A0ACC1SZS4_9APHY|nr:hypothetical protein NM688_g5159 [Phlebia brevispora]